MRSVSRNFTLRRSTTLISTRSEGWLVSISLLASVAAACVVLAASNLAARSANAEEVFGGPLAAEDLADIRGGDNDTTTNSHNVISTSESHQDTNANNEGNSIGGDSIAGSFNVQSGAFTDNRGMTNVVVNVAPQSNVQGIMSLTVVLH